MGSDSCAWTFGLSVLDRDLPRLSPVPEQGLIDKS
jgi:hypothetical protein